MKCRTTSSRSLSILLLAAFAFAPACSPSSEDAGAAQPAKTAERSGKTKVASSGEPLPSQVAAPTITPENVYDREEAWPNIASLVEPWTPADSATALKRGYRGAVIRVLPDALVRIDFGRHGEHDVPVASTDLVARANEVLAGARHKVAPNFLAHFGTQFLHPTAQEMIGFPTPELAKSEHFLCIFGDPTASGFEQLAAQLAQITDRPNLQGLFFPIGLTQDRLQAVKDRLQAVGWPVPFAYPQAAEKLAESLLDEIPTVPTALLITAEGRVLHRTGLSTPGEVDALRSATLAAEADASPSP